MHVGPTESLAPSGKSEISSTKVLDGIDIRLVARLPVVPQVMSRLFDACSSDATAIDELVDIINLDPGIAAKVIAVASTSVIEESNRPSNLTQCVTLVGLGVIKTIAIDESAARVFGRFSYGQELALTNIWHHSLKCALLAKALAISMDYPDPEEAYLAGLLHDIGSLALMTIDQNGYPQLLNRGLDEDNLCRLELDLYRTTHAGVGTWIADKWRLNSFLSDSIRYHHVPAERVADAHPLIRIVLLANHLSRVDADLVSDESIASAQLCNAPPESVRSLINNANEELDKIANELGIKQESSDVEQGGLLPNHPISQLGSKLEEKLILDSALSLMKEAKDLDAVLQRIAQFVLMSFGLQPSVFFLREEHGDAFVGKSLLPQHAKADQLRFLTIHAESAASKAVSGAATFWFVGDSWRNPLDAQLARLLDAKGIFCIPMGVGSKCKGLVVSAISSQHHADLLRARIGILQSFGKLAGEVLENVIAGGKFETADIYPETGASQEQIRHLLHEVSNPLSIVRNYLSVLDTSLGKDAGGRKELRIVAEEIYRVSQILDNFQQNPRQPPAPAGPVALQELVKGILDLCVGSRLVPPSVNIETHFHATPTVLIANPDKLKQALLNLLKNAFEAMPDGGTLRVSTSQWSNGGNDSHVELMLEDSGPGLPEEVQRKLYQQVSSTKGGQHFGIGLSIAAQLIREMSGLISCQSDQRGCRFRIILPVVT